MKRKRHHPDLYKTHSIRLQYCWNCEVPICERTMVDSFEVDVAEEKARGLVRVSICDRCFALAIVDEQDVSREPTPEEIRMLESEPETWAEIKRTRSAAIAAAGIFQRGATSTDHRKNN